VEANPGPPPPDWGDEDYAVLPDLLQGACPRLGIAPVRDGFATPTNRRFPALWADEVVTKAAREGCLMLVVATEWSGPGYLWWTALCGLCPTRCCFPGGRPVNLRGGTDLVPAPSWRTWAFLLIPRPPCCRARRRPRGP